MSESSRVKNCVTHHYACDCREWKFDQLAEKYAKAVECLQREECHCSSSTGELQTKGPDTFCNRCETLKELGEL